MEIIMAKNTNINLRNQVIYSIYVRNHTKEGTFNSIVSDLDRIKALGTDIIWFMPIHPIGVKNKKGSLGCPYAISNYREVNPCYGTMDDFKNLVNEIHKRDMKCMIDVVYNHTSPDNVLVDTNPQFYYRKPNGDFGNQVGEWWDVIDLDYGNKELWTYQIDTLKMWAEIVDGFRCDVASKIPVDFWIQARSEVAKLKEDFVWLAETIHPGFVRYLRSEGLVAHSDCEMYEAFDIDYDYDVRDEYEGYLKGQVALSDYVKMLMLQESVYPENYVKLRCLENHDNPRLKSYIEDEASIINFTAFNYFLKGTTLVHAGQETENVVCPSLFEYDKVDWNTGKDISELMRRLYDIKQDEIFAKGVFELAAFDECETAVGAYRMGKRVVVGVFSLKGKEGMVPVRLADGTYKNMINGKDVIVSGGLVDVKGAPIIMEGMVMDN